jgi:hypothetical protein
MVIFEFKNKFKGFTIGGMRYVKLALTSFYISAIRSPGRTAKSHDCVRSKQEGESAAGVTTEIMAKSKRW